MKAWRKHNSSSFVRKNPQFKLRKKQERRTHFAAEQSTPSPLLFILMYGKDWKWIVEQLADPVTQGIIDPKTIGAARRTNSGNYFGPELTIVRS